MAEPGQCFDNRRFIQNPADQIRRLQRLCGYHEPLALLAAGKALSGFKLEKNGYLSLFVDRLAVPADAYLVLPEFTRCRPRVLVEVGGIEVQRVDAAFRVFPVRPADLPQ